MKKIISIPEILIFIVLVGMCLFFQEENPLFLSSENVIVILRASAFSGICAVGMAFLLISGMIDISIGSIVGLGSVVVSYSMTILGLPIWLSMIITVGIGVLCGYVNSFVVQKFNVSAFLTTISTMYIFRGIAMTLSKGYTIYPLPENFLSIGNAEPLNVSWAFVIFIALVVIGELVLRFSVWGLTIKATGSDRQIAKMTEVNVSAITNQMFMICGGLAALSGILLTSRVQAGQPTMGTGWELNAIAAVAIGGVSLFGFSGSMFGVLCGVLLIQVLSNGLVSLGASAYLQPIEVGIVLLCIAVIDVRRRTKLNINEDIK